MAAAAALQLEADKAKRKSHSVLHAIKPYLCIAPAIVILAVFWVYPIFNMGYLSLFKWDLISPTMKFVGLQNFQKLFADPQFWQTLANTLIYTVFVVGLGVGGGLLIALFLKKRTKTNGFLQAVIFSPYVVSLASIALLWATPTWHWPPSFSSRSGKASAMTRSSWCRPCRASRSTSTRLHGSTAQEPGPRFAR